MKVLDGLIGLCVGDALGVPVEFMGRGELRESPVVGMGGQGTHGQPPGTWSDDSSLTFCLAESLCNGYDPEDMKSKFRRWLLEGYWTPHGDVFDVGAGTHEAIMRGKGGTSLRSNGNGSLMRILPLAYYVKGMEEEERFDKVREVSSLTHAHPISVIACSIYVEIAVNLLNGEDISDSYEAMKPVVAGRFGPAELSRFSRVLKGDVSKLPERGIKSGGYVLETLEAALWCCLNSGSYSEAVLKSVNLGGDTDTTGAVCGGLSGILHGFDEIPKIWVDEIARKKDIFDLATRFEKALGKRGD